MLLLFDLDGTLIENFLEERECILCYGRGTVRRTVKLAYVDDPCSGCRGIGRKLCHVEAGYDSVTWLSERLTILRALTLAGHDVAVCTNQTGVHYGYQTEEQVADKLTRVVHESGIGMQVYACLEPGPNRKPEPGMLLQAMREHSVERWETVFVGDMETDRQAADNACVAFAWADKFFGT